jgi:hypothetical protein
MVLDHFRAVQELLQPSTAGLMHPFSCFLRFPAHPQNIFAVPQGSPVFVTSRPPLCPMQTAQALLCLSQLSDRNASSRVVTWLVHWSATALSKASLLVWLRYVKFVTSTVGSIDALVPPTPNLTRYKRELAVKAEEAAVTGRNSPKSAK